MQKRVCRPHDVQFRACPGIEERATAAHVSAGGVTHPHSLNARLPHLRPVVTQEAYAAADRGTLAGATSRLPGMKTVRGVFMTHTRAE